MYAYGLTINVFCIYVTCTHIQKWSMSAWWHRLRLYVSDIFDQLAHRIYVLHPSTAFIAMVINIIIDQ